MLFFGNSGSFLKHGFSDRFSEFVLVGVTLNTRGELASVPVPLLRKKLWAQLTLIIPNLIINKGMFTFGQQLPGLPIGNILVWLIIVNMLGDCVALNSIILLHNVHGHGA